MAYFLLITSDLFRMMHISREKIGSLEISDENKNVTNNLVKVSQKWDAVQTRFLERTSQKSSWP